MLSTYKSAKSSVAGCTTKSTEAGRSLSEVICRGRQPNGNSHLTPLSCSSVSLKLFLTARPRSISGWEGCCCKQEASTITVLGKVLIKKFHISSQKFRDFKTTFIPAAYNVHSDLNEDCHPQTAAGVRFCRVSAKKLKPNHYQELQKFCN